jgi:hypothetical protein
MRWLPQTSGYSYPRVTAIRIVVHLAGETWYTTRMLLMQVHVHHMYASYGQSLYVATFQADPTELDGCTVPVKKCSWLHLSARLSGPPQFLSQHNHWINAFNTNICWWTCYVGLLDPYHQHLISTFNTCSQGPTHRFLTDRWGPQPWRCQMRNLVKPTA